MPELSRFYGIVIRMYLADHPPPHFHAHYGGEEARVDIRTLPVFHGRLSPRALGLVIERGSLHREGLLYRWERSPGLAPLPCIDPLRPCHRRSSPAAPDRGQGPLAERGRRR